ncbi:MAG: cation:proton antiporter [Saprospiraceae bacterium]|nr:cation:proton antiporter [Saprospiraceae bacterium]
MENSFLQNALILLGAALVFVPIAKKLGIGSVLGYLIGGIMIGPYVLSFIGREGEDIMHAAEFGVVMMLFLIGLELNPKSFWNMRKSILGMGVSQLLLSAILIFCVSHLFFGYGLNASIVVSLSLALSSTAIVLQTLKEKGLSNTIAGRASFSVLLLQDIAVIPILAVIPLLAVSPSVLTNEHQNLIDGVDGKYATLIIIGAVGLIFIISRFLINPFLHLIAKVRMRELFTATALFIVIGVAWLMEQVGVSAALGTFMAGVLLANSEFRHELESDIEPFKGVLLGLFFTAVGSTINFEIILNDPIKIFSFVFIIMLFKAIVLFSIGVFFKLKSDQNILFSLLLCQIGEFAFVLLAAAGKLDIINKSELDFLMATTTISMIISPILLFVNEKWIDPKFGTKEIHTEKVADNIGHSANVIIAGFGHFGSTIGRFLRANGVNAVILDSDSDRVDLLRKMGFVVYYGDATRIDLLKSAGAENAKIFISAIDSPEKNSELVEQINKHFPNLELFIRAKNRNDAYELLDLGVTNIYRETTQTSIHLGVDVLHKLGFRKYTATRKAAEFFKYDEAAMKNLAAKRHEKTDYILSVKNEIEMQEKLLSEDQIFSDTRQDSAWDSASRR